MNTGRIMKSGAAVSPLYPPSRLVRTAHTRANAMLEEARERSQAARAESERLLAQAREQAEMIREQAARQGAGEAAERLTHLLDQTRAELADLQSNLAARVTDLALRLARIVIDAEFSVKPERLVSLSAKALARASFSTRATVYLNPTDAELVERHAPALAGLAAFEGELVIAPDESLAPGVVRVETDSGGYETSIDEQFAALRRSLNSSDESRSGGTTP
ncbi:MAG: hypothetical protein JSR77_10245 [Planctomycetes bacterium]|nr:hypothetical protein [Planctomycetota bacterium]